MREKKLPTEQVSGQIKKLPMPAIHIENTHVCWPHQGQLKATNKKEGKSESKLGRRESNPHYRGLPQYVPCLLTEKATNRL